MMRRRFEVGDKYGLLEVVGAEEEYEFGGQRKKWRYDLRCECGNEVETMGDEWVRTMRDCGCGAAVRRAKTVLTITVPMTTREIIVRYAVREKTSLSVAVERIVSLFNEAGGGE